MRDIGQIFGIIVSVNNVRYRRIPNDDTLTLVFVEKVNNVTTGKVKNLNQFGFCIGFFDILAPLIVLYHCTT